MQHRGLCSDLSPFGDELFFVPGSKLLCNKLRLSIIIGNYIPLNIGRIQGMNRCEQISHGWQAMRILVFKPPDRKDSGCREKKNSAF